MAENEDEKQRKQLIWIFVIVVLIFASFLGTWFYVKSLDRFNYAGIKFEKIDYSGIEMYHGRFPIIYQGNLENYYNFYLRNDPRENNISMNTEVLVNRNIVISLEPDAGSCPGANMAQVELGKFLGAFGRYNVTGAVTDLNASKQLKVPYATCKESNENKTVFVVMKSDKPKIVLGGKDCYAILVGNCENVKTVERLMVGIIAQINEVKI